MRTLRETGLKVMRDVLRRQPASDAKVAAAWRLAAGATLARAATPRWRDDGTVALEVPDAGWRREVRRARPVLLERLASLLGDDVVRRLVILDGRAAPLSSSDTDHA